MPDYRPDDPGGELRARADARPFPPGPVDRADDPLDRPSRRRASMPNDQRVRLRRAALLAPERFPGPVGELLSRELLIWEDFGHRFGAHTLVSRLVEEILEPTVRPAVPNTASAAEPSDGTAA
ncbi:hypothetical protein GCM10010472_14750 [Pseudonocardia halophobica]|uniref:Uncharacterized protein n=1 Tax=Pseudonocardia halophobica TaxID=29401 RepID=A0A9W6NWU9_9PSEU|nr:hypothetical protein [Pseudonocardia halophobica]GLL11847.1 hypothetical protein GCM10017577_29880 [Pseudonocardia halophobica]